MSPPSSTYRVVVLAERPGENGQINDKTFRFETRSYADLKPGPTEVLFKILYLSCDATQRLWLNDSRGYIDPVKIGEPMRSVGVGMVVEAGEGSMYKAGDIGFGLFSWVEYAVVPEFLVEKIEVPPGSKLIDAMGAYGTPGLTAYFGIHDIGELKAGETIVISGAAGATGSMACQIAKKAGAKVVAIAGGPQKCEWLEKDLGVDRALDYKSPTFQDDFVDAVGYVDVYFDNVGGDILDLVLSRLNQGARIIACGAISEYNHKPKGLTNYLNIIYQRARMQGFIVMDYAPRYHEARAAIGKWLQEGTFKSPFYVLDGIDKCPESLPLMFAGKNTGKIVVKVADP